jgi:hypothetical protein
MAQILTNDIHFMKTYPMSSKGDMSDALLSFIHHVGIPASIHSDDAKEITRGKFKQLCQDYHIPITTTEPYLPVAEPGRGSYQRAQMTCTKKNAF